MQLDLNTTKYNAPLYYFSFNTHVGVYTVALFLKMQGNSLSRVTH